MSVVGQGATSMVISPEERTAQKRAWVARNRVAVNERRRELYAQGYCLMISERAKADRLQCPVCGAERRADYLARHIATRHPSA